MGEVELCCCYGNGCYRNDCVAGW